MRKYLSKEKKQEQSCRIYDWECKANGCTLPATRVTEWHDNLHGARGDQMDGAPKGGCCGYHADHKMHNWDTITYRINKMLPLLNVLGELDQLSSVQLAELSPTEVPRYSGSMPLEDETMFQWMRRMRGSVNEYVTAGLTDPVAKKTRSTVNLQGLIRDVFQT